MGDQRRGPTRLAVTAGLVGLLAVVAVGLWMVGKGPEGGPAVSPQGPAAGSTARQEEGRINPYEWPQGDAWPANMGSPAYPTRDDALNSVLAAVFNPSGPRKRDIFLATCRTEGATPFGIRYGWEQTFEWDAGGGMLPRTYLKDFPAIVPDVGTPDTIAWEDIRTGVQGDPLVVAIVKWRTKPDVAQVREVSLELLFHGPRPDHPEEGWCLADDSPTVRARGR